MPRVDDARVLSAIVHASKSGGHPGDGYEHVYGSKKTPYNHFRRWAERGVWESIFVDLAGLDGVQSRLFIDISCIKVHRTAGGTKEGPSLIIPASQRGRNTKLHAICDENLRFRRDCRRGQLHHRAQSEWRYCPERYRGDQVFGRQHRSTLPNFERDFRFKAYADNPYGSSVLGTPGLFAATYLNNGVPAA